MSGLKVNLVELTPSKEIKGIVQQRHHFDVYLAGPCACSDDTESLDVAPKEDMASDSIIHSDWKIGYKECCPGKANQIKYSKIYPKVCPVFNKNSGSPKWVGPPAVQCNYDFEDVKTTSDIQNWLKLFGENEDFVDIIMPEFCLKFDLDAEGKSISRFLSSVPHNSDGQFPATDGIKFASAGDACRMWAQRHPLQGNLAKQLFYDKYSSLEAFEENSLSKQAIEVQKTNTIYQKLRSELRKININEYQFSSLMETNIFTNETGWMNNNNNTTANKINDTLLKLNLSIDEVKSFILPDLLAVIIEIRAVSNNNNNIKPKVNTSNNNTGWIIISILLLLALIVVIVYLMFKYKIIVLKS